MAVINRWAEMNLNGQYVTAEDINAIYTNLRNISMQMGATQSFITDFKEIINKELSLIYMWDIFNWLEACFDKAHEQSISFANARDMDWDDIHPGIYNNSWSADGTCSNPNVYNQAGAVRRMFNWLNTIMTIYRLRVGTYCGFNIDFKRNDLVFGSESLNDSVIYARKTGDSTICLRFFDENFLKRDEIIVQIWFTPSGHNGKTGQYIMYTDNIDDGGRNLWYGDSTGSFDFGKTRWNFDKADGALDLELDLNYIQHVVACGGFEIDAIDIYQGVTWSHVKHIGVHKQFYLS